MNNHISSLDLRREAPRNVPITDFPWDMPTTATHSFECTVNSKKSPSPELMSRYTLSKLCPYASFLNSGSKDFDRRVYAASFCITAKCASLRFLQGIQTLTNALMNAMPAATQAETGPRDSGLLDMFHASHLKKPITIQVSHKKKSPVAPGLR